ncbi:MAG TPA: CoB--CoM heterodisulfide reductase iron-sulfur subunit A family protein [Gaiellaceae bacterium]|nr:CoB--CoM heterodisulfide reductase iron-sulfur subunit A family protein [Gaiellaceae bacterium]
MSALPERRIGVYVCQCGGNISDYVDVADVVAAVEHEPGVKVARTAMFTCSDATQSEIVADIRGQELDGLVVASCSPKLHTFTFRNAAKRAGLNPYQYTQVNIREQCSWAHTDEHEGATEKAIRLVRAGINRTRLTSPLEPLVVETSQRTLVVGGGIAGLRAAIGLSQIGLGVFLVERSPELGGWVGRLGDMYPHGRNGREIVERLVEQVRARPDVTVLTNAEVTGKSGSYGNYTVSVRVQGEHGPETIGVEVGAIVVATGFDTYQPDAGEFGYGIEGVLTLPELEQLLDTTDGPLEARRIAYVYCVGSRQPDGHTYCSRYCCPAAIHASLRIADRDPDVRQYHLYREMRAYGEHELAFAESRKRGSLYLRFADDDPPEVTRDGDGLKVTLRDLLTAGEEVTIPVDLLVLVTGMVPRENEELVSALKMPVGGDGFFNEIHPKLRPVETVVDGVLIAGACQGPKTASESVASGLAAVTQSAAMLKLGRAELDPQVAIVNGEACSSCGDCVSVCPYGAISLAAAGVAIVDGAGCKGCGACAPVCPEDAIDLLGYTDAQVRSMIDGLTEAVVA